MAENRLLVSSIGRFDAESETFSNYWKRFNFFIKVNKIEADLRPGVFLATVGSKTFALCQDLLAPKSLEDVTLDEIGNSLSNHFNPVKNVIYERFVFFSRNQKSGESIKDYVHALKSLACTCNFENSLNDMLRDRLVVGLRDQKIQRTLLTNSELTFDDAVKHAVSMDVASREVQIIQSGSVNVVDSKLDSSFKNKNFNNKMNFPNVKSAAKVPHNYSCFSCGSKSHMRNDCKFKQAKCFSCGRLGHVKKMCKSKFQNKNINVTTESCKSSDSVEYIFNMDSRDPIILNIKINNISVPMELDTGASRTVFPQVSFSKYFPDLKLKPSDVKLRKYGEIDIKVLGKAKVEVSIPGTQKHKFLNIIVVDDYGSILLGRDWLKEFDFSYKFNDNMTANVNSICANSVLDEFPDLFSDKLGTFKLHKVHIDRDGDVPAKFCKSRPVPYKLREKYNQALDKMIENNVIFPVAYSKWAAPVVPVMKPDNSIRLCGDYKLTANKAILMDSYPLPKPEDLFASLAGGTIFSKLDMSQAYLQLELDEDSKEITTINTPRGLFRFNRLCFGVSAAPGIFQRTVENVLRDIDGVCVYLDDILLRGENEKDHVNKLRLVLKTLQEAGFTLKKSKCEIGLSEVSYLGFVVNKDGLKPNPLKVRAIADAPSPKDITQLRSFLGMLNFYRKFLPNVSTILEKLNRLLDNGCKWHWTAEHEKAFKHSKELLLNSDLLVHFDPSLPIVISVDSSSYGIGAVLCHVIDGVERPVLFISRTLAKPERGYSQLEREALAIVFALKRFHFYCYGQCFKLITDHQPLLSIFGDKKNISPMASGRIQRWSLILQNYRFSLVHRSGKKLYTADLLSRLPLQDTVENVPVPAEWVYFVNEFKDYPITAEDIRNSTLKDPCLLNVIRCCVNGFPEKPPEELKPFYNKRLELSIQHDCILWGSRVVIPLTLRQKILSELHSCHVGICKMKELARSYFWWPSMDRDIEILVNSCSECLSVRPDPKRADLHPWDWPDRPWHRVHIDYAGPVGKDYFLIIVDAHSKWTEIYRTSGVTSDITIKCLRNCFSRFGLPVSLVSDNGPCFISSEFSNFVGMNGIHHIKTAVYKPSTNGLAENMVKTFKMFLKTTEGGDIQKKLDQFLFKYRNTPHVTTGVTPSELMFGRKVRTVFDLLKPKEIKDRVLQKQKLQKFYRDPKRSRNFDINPSDKILIKDFSCNNNKWSPASVIEQTGPLSYKCVTENNKIVKRHQDQILSSKPMTSSLGCPISDSENIPLDNFVMENSNIPVNSQDTNTSDSSGSEQVQASPVAEVPMVNLRRSTRVSRPPDKLDL